MAEVVEMTALIETKNLRKEFVLDGGGRLEAISDASIAINDKEFVCLLGPLRLRQVHVAAHSRGARERDGGRGSLQGRSGHGPWQGARHGLPGILAAAVAHRRRQRLARPRICGHGREEPPRHSDGLPRARRPRKVRRCEAARALGRDAPARRDSPRAREQPPRCC